jgi:hypothetical protein
MNGFSKRGWETVCGRLLRAPRMRSADECRGRLCPALSISGSCRQVIDLLQQIQNDRAEHHESYDVHGESPCGAGVARRASWSVQRRHPGAKCALLETEFEVTLQPAPPAVAPVILPDGLGALIRRIREL